MIRSRFIILAWLLLLVPTLLLGLGAFRLLQNEESQLAESGRAAAQDRISAIAGNIDLAVAEVQDGLQETLRNLSPEDLDRQLDAWKRNNPLVRNVFVWQQGRGLTFPDPEHPASDEEAAFIRRYLPLFANQADWQEHVIEEKASSPRVSNVFLERQELRQLAKQAPAPAPARFSADVASETAGMAASSAQESERRAPASGPKGGTNGWRSWYADNQLHLLGWFTPTGSHLRYGFEIEMMALVSRLLGNLPDNPGPGESYTLLDGMGTFVHMTGDYEVKTGSVPLASIPVTRLPHWQVAAYADPDAATTSGGVVLIGSLLLGTFIIAILLGGSMLLWLAWRNQRDARQKTSFVSSVSHELKTPLTTIRMYGELLGEGKLDDPAKEKRYLQTIIQESQRLTRLVNNILDFSRLEQGRKEYAWERVNLNLKLRELLDAQTVRFEEAGMETELLVPAQAVMVETDRDALDQIVLNLLDNAVKYAREGKRLTLHLEERADQCELQFCDRGPGVPASHQQRVFDQFHRVDISLTARQQGSGLGLSISRQLARGLGGDLVYRSQSAGGACFVLTLPSRRTS